MSFDKHNQTEDFSGANNHDFTADAFVSVQRDPEDVLTISHLLRLGLVLVVLLFFKLRVEFFILS